MKRELMGGPWVVPLTAAEEQELLQLRVHAALEALPTLRIEHRTPKEITLSFSLFLREAP